MTLSEYEVRQAKVTALKNAGVVPYANRFERTHTIAELRTLAANYNMPDTELLMEEGAENTYSVAGRIVMFRSHGKLSFATIRDGS
jgi:lysyl-tRNA synthetase class 2